MSGTWRAITWFLFTVAGSIGVAAFWVAVLDAENDPGDLNLTALNSLNLIVGFLYVGVISHARNRWKETMQHANNFTFVYHELAARSGENKIMVTIKLQILNFFRKKADSSTDENVEAFRSVFDKLIQLQDEEGVDKALVGRLKHCTLELERAFFEKEPVLFTLHLQAVLLIYFFCIPVQLFNAYDARMTYILYPIIIYLLFSVVLYANAFQNPVSHPELNQAFSRLNKRLLTTNTLESVRLGKGRPKYFKLSRF
tara:strand:+ start:1271 stop:2035 length:765 start_codon:yes stop_codon:yes gene_type:complete